MDSVERALHNVANNVRNGSTVDLALCVVVAIGAVHLLASHTTITLGAVCIIALVYLSKSRQDQEASPSPSREAHSDDYMTVSHNTRKEDTVILKGKKLKEGRVKQLIRPSFDTTTKMAGSCSVKVLNSDRKFQDIVQAFHGVKHILIVVGKTGSGKTSLLDTLVNYFYGISFESNLRYTMKSDQELKGSQTESQTKDITVYILIKSGTKLILIDTPGFGDTHSREVDEGIPKKLKALIDESKNPVINGVCFVCKGSTNRLDDAERHVFKSVLRMFPKTAIKATFACFTYCLTAEEAKDASIAFTRGIYGDENRAIHHEFVFDNSKTMYGVELHEMPKAAHGSLLIKAGYEVNTESCSMLFEAMQKTRLDSEDISKVITNVEQGAQKVIDIQNSIVRTCEEITKLMDDRTRAVAGQSDVYCKLCKKYCCLNCLHQTVMDCAEMVVVDSKSGFKQFAKDLLPTAALASVAAVPMGISIGLFAAASYGLGKLIDTDTRECRECKHSPHQHEFIPARECPSSREISKKIEQSLMNAKRNLAEQVEELREIIRFLEEKAWSGSDMDLASFRKRISKAIREKCSDNEDAYSKCNDLLMFAFSEK